jgi:hypothetical protein
MIDCPKCGFSQPQDIYCASCGVKMDSYTKKEKSFFMGLLTNWILQLGILIILIVGFVIYDKTRTTKPVQAATPTADVANTFQRRETPPLPQPSNEEPQPVEAAAPLAKPAPQKIASGSTRSAGKGKTLAELAQENDLTAKDSASASKNNNPGIQISFYRITRPGLAEIQRSAQTSTSAGQTIGGIVNDKKIKQLLASGDMQYLSGNRYKELDEKHPTVVFKGQRHAEAARNMGVFIQLAPLKTAENSVQMELKGWGVLKLNEPDENYFSTEMTFTQNTAAFIAAFLPRDKTFSDEEKQLFESDRLLKVLNQEDFADGSTDMILIVEFSKSR